MNESPVVSWQIVVAVLVLLALGTTALYWPGLSGPFLFDDIHTVEQNPWVQAETLSLSSLWIAAQSFVGGGRELAMASFAVNHVLFGPDPFAYKAVNLALHLACGLFVYLLTAVLVSRLVPADAQRDNPLLRFAALLVAALWLASPINLTSVLYVSQRMTSMAALFMFLGAWLYLSARIHGLENGRIAGWRFLGVLACLPAAWFSKQNGILLLPLLVVLEVVVFRFAGRDGRTRWPLVVLVFGGGLLAVVVTAVHMNLDLATLSSWYAHRPFTLEERVLTQGRLLVFYIGLVLFPLSSRFGLWHDDIAFSTGLFTPVDTFTSLLLLGLLMLLAAFTWRRYPLVTVGVFWYFVGHSLESSIFPLEMVHEHRNYLPSYGVVLALVGFLGYLRRLRPCYGLVLLGALLAASAVNLHARAVDWSDEYRHAFSEFSHHPTSPRATFQLAAVNLKLAYQGYREGEQAAFMLLELGRELGDRTILPETAMIMASSVLDQEVEDVWIEDVVRKLDDSGGFVSDALALRGLRECLEKSQCDIEPARIRPVFEAAARTRVALLVDEASRYFNSIGDARSAFFALERAARFSAHHVQIKLNYVGSLLESGMLEEAQRQFELLLPADQDVPARFQAPLEALRRELIEAGAQ